LISPYSFNQPDCRIESCAGRVTGTHICWAGAGTRTGMRAGAGRGWDEKFFVRVTEC